MHGYSLILPRSPFHTVITDNTVIEKSPSVSIRVPFLTNLIEQQ